MSKYNIHSDFKKYEKTAIPLFPPFLPLINIFLSKSFKKIKPIEGVHETKYKMD